MCYIANMRREDLVQARKSKGISKVQMAAVSGVSYATILRYEAGKNLRDYIQAPLDAAYKALMA